MFIFNFIFLNKFLLLTGARDEHVQLLDVIAVLPSRRGVCLDKTNRACSPDHVELTVYEARRKQPYNRIVHPIVVEFNDPAVCQEWCARLQDFLAGKDASNSFTLFLL